MPKEIDLPLLNNFLRLAIGGWDSLPVNDSLTRNSIFPLIKELDPEERYWHIEGDIIWKISPWKELWNKTLERRERREEKLAQLEERKRRMDELVRGIQTKFNFMLTTEQAENLAKEIVRNKSHDVAKEFGVGIEDLVDTDKPHIVMEEGKVVCEY